MSAIDRHRSPIYRQLEAYGESWTRDHDEAMACREWEDIISVGINIFHMLRDREQAWRDQVFRGVISYSEEDNLDHHERFANWLETTREVLGETLPELEKHFGHVEGATDLRACAKRAEQIVSEWQPPRLSLATGLREMTLSPEAATELDRILEQGQQLPPEPPHPKMQEMPLADLKRLSRNP